MKNICRKSDFVPSLCTGFGVEEFCRCCWPTGTVVKTLEWNWGPGFVASQLDGVAVVDACFLLAVQCYQWPLKKWTRFW